MTGFYLGEPLDNAAVREQGIDAMPETAGAVLGATVSEAIHNFPTNQIWRAMRRGVQSAGAIVVDPITGTAMATDGSGLNRAAPPPMLSPDELNRRFKLPGMTPFTSDTPEVVAQGIFDAHQQKLQRESVLARREGVGTGMVPRFGVALLTSLLDPLNVASAFIPVIPEAKVAAWLAGQAGAIGRAGVRVQVGAASGAVGMAALEPLNYIANRAEHEDWTMGNAAMNIAMGAALGAVLHAGVGAIGDRYRAPPAQVRALDPETAEMAMRGSIAQTLDGQPVAVGNAIRAAHETRVVAEIQEGLSRRPDIADLTLRENIRAPESLLQFIAAKGGVMEQGGDLAAIGAREHFVPGGGMIVRRDGMTLDYAREAAEEAGFLRSNSTIADFLDAVSEEVAGRRVYRPHDIAIAQERATARYLSHEEELVERYRAEIREIADSYGVRVTRDEEDAAILRAMDGEHPETSLREILASRDLAQDQFFNGARDVAESANVPSPTIAQTRVELEALQARAPKVEGDAAKELAEATGMVAEMEKRLRVDLDNHPEGAAMKAHLDRMNAQVADETAIANAFPTISSIVCRGLGGPG